MNTIYTIGCSNQSIEEFINLLLVNKITAIADVRSTPYSRFTPQFNAEALSELLNKKGIKYLSFSKEFGARREDESDYSNGKVDYNKVIESEKFIKGIDRIKNGIMKGFKIALMCTEKDPIDCHRFSLVSRGINKKTNLDIKHIHLDGTIETNQNLQNRLLKKYSLQQDFFIDDILSKAYNLINNEIGYEIGAVGD